MNNPQLIIDAGHGGSDPGASGNGIVEKQLVLDISLYQYQRFLDLGISTLLTRQTDMTLLPNERSAQVKSSGAKHCISNHINAAATASGAEFIHSMHSSGAWAKMMADMIAQSGQLLRRTATYSKRNNAGQDYFFMHRQTGQVETVIVEYGFLTNAADATRLKENWKQYAEAIVKAYCGYAGYNYVAPADHEPASKQKQLAIVVNDKPLSQKGILVNDVTYVPIRSISEALGASVEWDAASSTVNIKG